MKKWNIQNKIKNQKSKIKNDELIAILLENRGIKTKKEIEEFLHPKLENVTPQTVGIDKSQLKKAVKRIQKAIEEKEQIVVFGDYDVDGICGSAILWETLYSLGANVLPYIPHRIDQGYGLSVKGIEDLCSSKNEMPDRVRHDNIKLIITVDNGIVANDAVEFAKSQGIDVIITDHHVPSKDLPKAYAIVHTTKLCGTGVAWLFSRVILNSIQDLGSSKNEMPKQVLHDKNRAENHLELVALATVADLVSLTGANRTLLKFGLEKLRKTKRPGFLALFKEAVINQSEIGTYEIGHIIAPRLNAMGRLEYAMDSLRLICTKSAKKAEDLAFMLGSTNRQRQVLTLETVQHAITKIKNQKSKIKAADQNAKSRKLIFIAEESYQQGVIGLVAGRLVEEFYLPSIVVSIGDKHSKASARSVSGFNIIEFIRSASEHLVDAGGHPMAAGFTVETAKLSLLQKALEERALELLNEDLLTRTLKIDCEIPLDIISKDLYKELQKLSPFGMGNFEPTFVSKRVIIEDIRLIGKDRKHIKFRFSCHPELISGSPNKEMLDHVRHDKKEMIDGVGFGLGERAGEFHIGDKVDIVYTIDENVWNGNTSLQLKIKDIKPV